MVVCLNPRVNIDVAVTYYFRKKGQDEDEDEDEDDNKGRFLEEWLNNSLKKNAEKKKPRNEDGSP